VEELLATVNHLRIMVGTRGETRRWLACGDLIVNPDLLSETARSTAAFWGTDDDMVAMSLFVQGYVYRVASTAIGSFVLSGDVLSVRPETTEIALDQHRLNAVRLASPELVEADGDLSVLHRVLIDEHLAPLVDTAHRSMRVGEALLWGNVGSSCAASFGAFIGSLPQRAELIRQLVEGFFATARDPLRRSGRVVRIGDGPKWMWERKACCLYYQTEVSNGDKCADCSLWTPAERSARYAEALVQP
jgi:ferric iron reductase protein FhuF